VTENYYKGGTNEENELSIDKWGYEPFGRDIPF
jgi:hypothetical protein